jgi:hypothetical protein
MMAIFRLHHFDSVDFAVRDMRSVLPRYLSLLVDNIRILINEKHPDSVLAHGSEARAMPAMLVVDMCNNDEATFGFNFAHPFAE